MSVACDHLLRFQPIFRRFLWGGRRLGSMLGKPIGPEDDYAESWEIVDHGADQSVVRAGPLAGSYAWRTRRADHGGDAAWPACAADRASRCF